MNPPARSLTELEQDDLLERIEEDLLYIVPDDGWRDAPHDGQPLTQVLVQIVRWSAHLNHAS